MRLVGRMAGPDEGRGHSPERNAIRNLDNWERTVMLDFPNREVENAFSFHLLSEFVEKSKEATDSLVLRMRDSLNNGDGDSFMAALRGMYAGIGFDPEKRNIGEYLIEELK